MNKKYMEMELNDDLLSMMKQQKQDPREWDQRMVNSHYKPIGKSKSTASRWRVLKPPTRQSAALRKYADTTGQYPENLSLMTRMGDLGKGMKNKIPAFDPNQFEGTSVDKKTNWTMNQMMPIQSLGMFYMTLVQQKKDPACYGGQVAPRPEQGHPDEIND